MSIKSYFSIFDLNSKIIEFIKQFELKPSSSNIEREAQSLKLIDTVARFTASISLFPLPFPDLLVLTGIQAAMVIKIAEIHEQKISLKLVEELLKGFLSGLISKNLSGSLNFLFPLARPVICFTSAYLTTKAIGYSALKSFSNKQGNKSLLLDFESNIKKISLPDTTKAKDLKEIIFYLPSKN